MATSKNIGGRRFLGGGAVGVAGAAGLPQLSDQGAAGAAETGQAASLVSFASLTAAAEWLVGATRADIARAYSSRSHAAGNRRASAP